MNLSNFPERLSELIFYTGKSATNLSVELGYGNATLNHYLNERYLPTVEIAVRLADYFNCSVDYLLGIADENRAQEFKSCPPFKEQLLTICKTYNISRYKLHIMTSIPESVMRYWVKGKTKPSLVNIVKIAEALNCSIDFVLGREK